MKTFQYHFEYNFNRTLHLYSYFQEVLSSSQLASETNEIQLNKDGSWSTHVMNSDSQNLDTPHKNFTNVEVISDDLGKFMLMHYVFRNFSN